MDSKYLGRKSLIEIMHEQLKDNSTAEAEKHDPCKFYPSSVGKCLRSIVYQMLGYKGKGMDSRILLILENGTSFHERTEKLFADTGLLIAPELPIKRPDLRLSGRSDALIVNFLPHESSKNVIKLFAPQRQEDIDAGKEPLCVYEGPDNDCIMVELKSISDSGFEYVSKKGPKPAHVMQLQLYMHLTGVKQGLLLYENKNNQMLKEFMVGYDPEMAQKIIEKIESANKHVDAKKLPPREFERTDYDCMYCDFYDTCWEVQTKYTLEDVI